MRRAIALLTIAALVAVSGVPLLPDAPVCAFAAERMQPCDACHDDAVMAQGMRHDTAAMDHHHKGKLSAAQQRCRIECGCGCHADLDGLPHQLAPHVTATEAVACARILPAAPAVPPSPMAPFSQSIPIPPPKAFS